MWQCGQWRVESGVSPSCVLRIASCMKRLICANYVSRLFIRVRGCYQVSKVRPVGPHTDSAYSEPTDYLSVCIYIYAYMHSIYIYMYTRMRTYIYLYVNTYTDIHIYIHVFIGSYVHESITYGNTVPGSGRLPQKAQASAPSRRRSLTQALDAAASDLGCREGASVKYQGD